MKAEIRVRVLRAKEHPRLPANHQKLQDREGADSISQFREGINHEDTLILNFKSPDLWQIISVVKAMQSVLLCYDSLADQYRSFVTIV